MKNSTRQNKASSLFLAVIMVISMAAVGFAATPAAAQDLGSDADFDESDYDRLIGGGDILYQGQQALVNVSDFDTPDDAELRRVDGDGNVGGFVSARAVVEDNSSNEFVILDTSERENDQYVVTEASRGVDASSNGVEFELVTQDVDLSFAEDSLANTGDSEVDIDVSSDLRNNYVVTFTADGLNEDELEGLFNTSDNSNVTGTYVDDDGNVLRAAISENRADEAAGNYILTEDAIHVFDAEGTRTLDFEGISPGEYTFTADVLDTTAQSTSEIGVFGEVVGPGDPPEYDLKLENDGTAYTIGFPGPTDGTLNDVFANGFEGVSAVYEYDANADQWRLLEGDEFDESPAALDAIVIVTTGETGPNEIDLEVTFTNESVTSPTSQTLTEGWTFTTASTADNADTVFDRGSAEATVVLDAFATPEVQQVDTAQSFQYQQSTPYYDLGTGEPPQMSPFAGYFVHVTESGSHPSLLSGIETRQESDAALNLTDVS